MGNIWVNTEAVEGKHCEGNWGKIILSPEGGASLVPV